MDESGRPLYGDVFRKQSDLSDLTEEQKRQLQMHQRQMNPEDAMQQGHWGDFVVFEVCCIGYLLIICLARRTSGSNNQGNASQKGRRKR